MTRLTTLDALKQHITLLVSVEKSDALFISFYLNLEDGGALGQAALAQRAGVLRQILKGNDLADFERALRKINAYVAAEILPEAKGLAIFVRGNLGGAFLLPMQFAVPLPNWIAVYPTPNIYHLVELKDTYHRYVVLLATAERARILDVNLGATTVQAWTNQPELHGLVGEGWSRSHYQVHRANRGERFLKEKLAVLERLMRAGGHAHLILAGDPQITAGVRRALPNDLAIKLVDTIPAFARDKLTDVVMATLSSFIAHEEQESQAIAERLLDGLLGQDLAVAGSRDTLDALRRGHVDTLVMAQRYQPDPGWTCSACNAMGTDVPETPVCPQCGQASARALDVKEALLRLAGQSECPVEVVEHADELMALGGVGCLLRIRPRGTQWANAIAAPAPPVSLPRTSKR